VGLRPGPH